MAQRYKFSIESKNFPLDISGEPVFISIRQVFLYAKSCIETTRTTLSPYFS